MGTRIFKYLDAGDQKTLSEAVLAIDQGLEALGSRFRVCTSAWQEGGFDTVIVYDSIEHPEYLENNESFDKPGPGIMEQIRSAETISSPVVITKEWLEGFFKDMVRRIEEVDKSKQNSPPFHYHERGQWCPYCKKNIPDPTKCQ